MDEDIRKWFKQKWVNIGKKVDGKHPPCGTSGKKSGYAKCVPAAKASGMSKKEKESATRRKRAAQNKADRGGSKSSGQGKTPIYVSTKKNESNGIIEAKFKSPDYIMSTTPADSLESSRLPRASVLIGIKMAEILKKYTLEVKHYNLVHHKEKIALKLTPAGKMAVKVRTNSNPKYLELIETAFNKLIKDYIRKLVNEDWSSKYKSSIDCNNPKGFSQKAHCAGKKKNESTKIKLPNQMTIEEKLELFLEKNCPNDPGKWSASKAAAKSKFDVYPSVYANAFASKNYKKKGGTWKKCKTTKESAELNEARLSEMEDELIKQISKLGFKATGKASPVGRSIYGAKDYANGRVSIYINTTNANHNDDSVIEVEVYFIPLYFVKRFFGLRKDKGLDMAKMKSLLPGKQQSQIIDLGTELFDRSPEDNIKDIVKLIKDADKEYNKEYQNYQPELKESEELNEACWEGYKQVGGKMKNGKLVPNCVPINESTQELNCDENGNCWEMEPPRYQSTSMGYREMNESDCGCSEAQIKEGNCDCDESIEEYDVETIVEFKSFAKYIREYTQLLTEATCPCLLEAEYQGRNVKLGKIMQGDVKKFKVYVKNPQGNVVKVNFGFGGSSAKGKRMTIKKNNPERRKNFRARHNCDNPGPRHKARYWACRTW